MNLVPINSCLFTENDVLQILLSLDQNKSPGPDLLPPLLIKKCAQHLCSPLHKLFRTSLDTGVFPNKWKTAYITPIYKDGENDDISHYRPISLLSVCAKVFESLIQKRILPLIQPTSSNLIEYVSDLCVALDNNKEVHAIYTDFRKAFDLVNHDLLLAKLQSMGIHGSLLRWCESYLQNRSQLVSIGGYKSFQYVVPTGVPQGSHLGPLFFLVFINDLCDTIHCQYKAYADDLKLYRVIESSSDIQLLQSDINNIVKWCTHNNMLLNPDKCFHIKFTRKKLHSLLIILLGQLK